MRPLTGRWVAPVLGVLLILAVLPAQVAPAHTAWWDMASVFLTLPAIVGLGMAPSIGRPASHVGSVLGRWSYPLYVLHYPVLVAVIEAAKIQFPTARHSVVGVAAVATALAVAWVVLVVYDEPVRAALTRRLTASSGHRPRAALPSSAA
jgi:peptidoglycan/LPS O-acetylase OafA/YrhL